MGREGKNSTATSVKQTTKRVRGTVGKKKKGGREGENVISNRNENEASKCPSVTVGVRSSEKSSQLLA